MDEPTPVTVIGLGDMGSALAGAFLDAGHRTTVWNRTPERADRLVAAGAHGADTAADALQASPVAVVCLLDDAAVHAVLDPHAATLSGRLLINLTNGTPAQARAAAKWAGEHGADYLDGGIMAIPPMIATPEAFVLYSGSSGAFDAYRPLLDCLGESRYLGADPGMASLQDLALLSGMYGMLMGVMQAFALVGTEGVEATGFAPLLSRWLDAMSGGLIPIVAEQLDKADYTIGVTSNVAMQAAAYVNILQGAKEQGLSPELLVPLRALMDQRVASGHGREDITGVVELLKTARPV